MIENLMVHPVEVIGQQLTGAEEDGTPEHGPVTRWTGDGWLQTPKNVYPREQRGEGEVAKKVERRSTLFLPADAIFYDDDQFRITEPSGVTLWDCRGHTPVHTPFVGLHHYEVAVIQQGNA